VSGRSAAPEAAVGVDWAEEINVAYRNEFKFVPFAVRAGDP
jgi:hypothetical protein